MYDENKWNEVNNENEKKNNEQPINTQNTQNTQNGAQQPQGEHTGRQVYGRLGSGTQNGQPYNGNPNGQNGYYSGQQHQQYYGNQNQYTNPYQQYDYYQGHGQNPNGNGNSHHASKKHSYAKTTALVAAAALLFGVVSGGTMYGVNRAANTLLPYQSSQVNETIGQTTQIPAANTSTTSSNGVVIEDVSAIVDATLPSVVSITNTQVYQSNTWFGQSQTYEVPSSGSGIIVGQNDSELLIVTNNHVVSDSEGLTVTFADESTADAAIKGTDSEADLAVIAVPLDKISADTKDKIKAATLGDSDSLKMGQGVIAIGNALGLGQSVTVGHVSALNREIKVDDATKTVIQTDAAINPGNSGGALLNSKGEVIGINEAKYADTSVEGVGYAIPISKAKDIIDDLMTRTTKIAVSESEQGYLGIQLRNIDESMAKMYGMPQGVYVYKIMEDSAAAGSDLHEKDIITKLDGEKISNYADLAKLLTYYKSGDTVTLTVQSLVNGSYQEREVQLTLKQRPAESDSENSQSQGGQQDQKPAQSQSKIGK